MSRSRRVCLSSLAIALLAIGTACARLGYSSRTLWRVPSPDGRLIAVCQEIPEFDGPGLEVRLEDPAGRKVRVLYRIGDGDPCSEVAWAADGRTLAVLSGHVARMRFVDVGWALDHPGVGPAHWLWRQVDLSTDTLRTGRRLRFTAPFEVELTVCPYDIRETQRTGEVRCTTAAVEQRVPIPRPIVTGHPSRLSTPHVTSRSELVF